MSRYLYEYGDGNQGMGSWLSKVFDAATGKSTAGQTAIAQQNAALEGSFSLIISQQLAAVCLFASPADIAASVKGILTAYNAYQTAGTSPDVATSVISATVADLTAKGKVANVSGCSHPNTAIPVPAAVNNSLVPMTTGINPLLLGAGGLALFAVLMMGRR